VLGNTYIRKFFDKFMKVKTGNKVTVSYVGTFEDGKVFDSSKENPLQFVVGKGMVIKGFDDAVVGMKEGQEKTFTIKPEEGYGFPKPELVKEVPRDFVPKDKEVEPGMMIALGTNDGRTFPAKIVEVNNAFIKVDLNHPLAGKKLIFKIKVLKIEENNCKTDSDKECCNSHDCDCEDDEKSKEKNKKEGSVEDLL
jgi:FKBP-type peptidyl-prolyl cis-trans isomerase 2